MNLKTSTSVEWEADNNTRASRGLNPHITAVVENGLAGEREPKPQPILFAGGYERFEYLMPNLVRNSGPRVFDFNQHIIAVSGGPNANLSAARHRFKSVRNQVKEHQLHTRARQPQRYLPWHIEQDLNSLIIHS